MRRVCAMGANAERLIGPSPVPLSYRDAGGSARGWSTDSTFSQSFGSAEQIPRRAPHSSLRHVHFGVTALFRAGAVTFMRMQTGTCGQMLEITRPFASRPFRSRRVPEMTCIRPSEVARVAVPKTVCNRLHRTPFTQLLLGRHHLDRVKIRVRTLLKLLLEKTVKCRR